MSYHYNQDAPPYPYQQPLQQQHSGNYAPYPRVDAAQQEQDKQRWGTPVMGAPSNPNAHPDNVQAATGELGASNRQGSGIQYNQTQAPPSNVGQVPQDSYQQANSGSGTPGKGGSMSMDQLKAQVTEFSKTAQTMANNVWSHLSTGPSVADTAWGRVTAGTQLLTKGGFEGVFKSTFSADADEKLKKTYACFLSTSTGPVAGTLYISNKKLAFCSDRPLSYTPPNGQQSFSYYKVIIPVNRVKEVNPSANQNKPAEKYIQIVTTDKFEFWFMGFVNYDKGVKNLQAVLDTSNQAPSGPSQQQPYPPNQSQRQDTYPPNQQPPRQDSYPPNQYGTPAP